MQLGLQRLCLLASRVVGLIFSQLSLYLVWVCTDSSELGGYVSGTMNVVRAGGEYYCITDKRALL